MDDVTSPHIIEFSLTTVAGKPSDNVPHGKLTQALLATAGYALGSTVLGSVIGATLGALDASVITNGAFIGLCIGIAVGLPQSIGLLRG